MLSLLWTAAAAAPTTAVRVLFDDYILIHSRMLYCSDSHSHLCNLRTRKHINAVNIFIRKSYKSVHTTQHACNNIFKHFWTCESEIHGRVVYAKRHIAIIRIRFDVHTYIYVSSSYGIWSLNISTKNNSKFLIIIIILFPRLFVVSKKSCTFTMLNPVVPRPNSTQLILTPLNINKEVYPL